MKQQLSIIIKLDQSDKQLLYELAEDTGLSMAGVVRTLIRLARATGLPPLELAKARDETHKLCRGEIKGVVRRDR